MTGANGFIGSWLAAALCDAEARVVALVRDAVPDGGLCLHGLESRVTRIPGDQDLDSALARERLGWAPRVPLREGLAAALDWYRGHLLGAAQPVLAVGSH